MQDIYCVLILIKFRTATFIIARRGQKIDIFKLISNLSLKAATVLGGPPLFMQCEARIAADLVGAVSLHSTALAGSSTVQCASL